MILLQLHYNQMFAVFKLSQGYLVAATDSTPVLIRNFTLKTMNRKLKLKVSYRANFARHIFPIVITYFVSYYRAIWVSCALSQRLVVLYVSKKAVVLYTKLLICDHNRYWFRCMTIKYSF